MADILSSIIKPRNILSARCADFFRISYNFCKNYSKDVFLQCREAAIEMSALLFVDHMKQKQKEFDKFVISAMNVKKK